MSAAPIPAPPPASTLDEINFLYDQNGVIPTPKRNNNPVLGEEIDTWLYQILKRIKAIHCEQDEDLESTEDEVGRLDRRLQEEEADLCAGLRVGLKQQIQRRLRTYVEISFILI